MKRYELVKIRKEWFRSEWQYQMCEWLKFDYSVFRKILYFNRNGRGSNTSVSDCIIMADTETSKKIAGTVCENHVCAWTISIRAFDMNICTLYGRKPSHMVKCIKKIVSCLSGVETIIYFHNLAYDWVFLRAYLMDAFGFPEKQLNTKPHYPIYIKFGEITLKDSLILAQRSLDKWAKDMNVEHQKAVGKWDYDLIRNQDWEFTPDELEYIEHDTLAGVECIQALMNQLNKNIATLPYTATGIPREAVRKLGKSHNARKEFLNMALTFEQYQVAELVYHGGYTHANRFLAGRTQLGKIDCYDFASSYPFCMLAYKFPMQAFKPILAESMSVNDILETADRYAYMFRFIARKIELKDYYAPMPALQFSKCLHSINAITDNGRVLQAEYVEIYLNEIDMEVIAEQYRAEFMICVDVERSYKQYLPRWFTDYTFSLFRDKTMLKGAGDPVAYAIAKATLNSLYGMCCQKNIKEDIVEDYLTGDYSIAADQDARKIYDDYINKHGTILLYSWGSWVTSYATRNLFELGKCCEKWIYSDTDSCYGQGWNIQKLEAYNDNCKQLLRENGYGCVYHNDREYWLGIAEHDGTYTEFKALHAKCYCGRSENDGKLHITVAGVPKKGAECLNDDINNFAIGTVFPGVKTGKQTHTYIFKEPYIDKYGNETADSIDLSPCDYLVGGIEKAFFDAFFQQDVYIQTYED